MLGVRAQGGGIYVWSGTARLANATAVLSLPIPPGVALTAIEWDGILLRGARYPNKAELAAFGENNEIRTQWHDGAKKLYDDDNNLSDVGRRQMETLGRFFGGEYAQLLGNECVRWESSPAERCEESGKLFL